MSHYAEPLTAQTPPDAEQVDDFGRTSSQRRAFALVRLLVIALILTGAFVVAKQQWNAWVHTYGGTVIGYEEISTEQLRQAGFVLDEDVTGGSVFQVRSTDGTVRSAYWDEDGGNPFGEGDYPVRMRLLELKR